MYTHYSAQERTNTNWTALFDEYRLNCNEFDTSMFAHMQSLILLRQQSAAFSEGILEFIENSEDKVLSYIRQHDAEQYAVVINLSDRSLVVNVHDERIQNNRIIVYRSGQRARDEEKEGVIHIFPCETIIYQIGE